MRRYFEKIYKGNLKEFCCVLDKTLEEQEKMFIVTANPETLMIGEENSEFKDILLSNITTITPDGIGVVKGAQMLGYSIQERVTGVDIVQYLFESANKKNKSLYLLGAKPEVIEKLAEKIRGEFPEINLLGFTNGYVEDKDAVFEEIRKLNPDVVLVALGIPAQEMLIRKHYDAFEKGIFVGVGGAFDVLSGTKKRAPQFFVDHNLEWLYRIVSEPQRIKRFYKSNVRYLRIIRKLKERGDRNEKN